MTSLTDEQLTKLHVMSKVGTRLPDCLRVLGLSGERLKAELDDQTVQDVAAQARSEGATELKERLYAAARGGNVSAAKVLKMYGPDDSEEAPAKVTFNEAGWRKLMAEIRVRVDQTFERQRRLLQEHPNG